jgi:hypothetical protein
MNLLDLDYDGSFTIKGKEYIKELLKKLEEEVQNLTTKK